MLSTSREITRAYRYGIVDRNENTVGAGFDGAINVTPIYVSNGLKTNKTVDNYAAYFDECIRTKRQRAAVRNARRANENGRSSVTLSYPMSNAR